MNIDGQVISSGEKVCEGTYHFPINIGYLHISKVPLVDNHLIVHRMKNTSKTRMN